MEKSRQIKMMFVIALVLSVTAMTLGFAAFSTTLNISSSASVSPNSDNFSIGFYANKSQASNSTVTIFPSMSTGSSGSSIDIIGGSKTLSGLKARFLKPGDVVVYDVVIKNDGEYDAYLNSVNMSQNATCVAEDEATDSLVQSACEGIKIAFMLDGYNGNVSGNVNIPIAVGEYLNAQIIMRYREDSAYADGPFSVSFEPITLDFSTVQSTSNLITFTIDGTSYQAEEGMTWQEWLLSDYVVDDSLFVAEYAASSPVHCNHSVTYNIYSQSHVSQYGKDYIISGATYICNSGGAD